MQNKFSIKYIWVVLILILPIYFFYNPSSSSFFPECPFHKFTGYHCPGCGSQRAIHDVFNFNFLDALSHNILMVSVLSGGLLLYFYSKKKFFEIVYHPKTPYTFLTITVAFWILRNLNFSPFNWLAP